MGLRWGAVDLRHGRLKVRVSRTLGEDNPPKTVKSAHEITLLPEVVAVLRAAKPLHAAVNTFVFPTQAGTPLDEERFVEKHWHRGLRGTDVRPGSGGRKWPFLAARRDSPKADIGGQ